MQGHLGQRFLQLLVLILQGFDLGIGSFAFQGSLPALEGPVAPGKQGLVADPCFLEASLIESSPRRMLSTMATFSKSCLHRKATALQFLVAILLIYYPLLPRKWCLFS